MTEMATKFMDARLRAELKELSPSVSEEDFIKEAVKEKIRSLKLARVLAFSERIRSGLRKKGTTIEKILKDFEKTT